LDRDLETTLRLNELGWLYDHLPIGLGVLDSQLQLMRANPVLMTFFDHTSDPVGQPIATLLPDAARTIESAARAVLRSGQPREDLKIVEPGSKVGDERAVPSTWSCRIQPLRSPSGSIEAVVLVIQGTGDRTTSLNSEAARELMRPLTAIVTNAQAARRLLEAETDSLDELRSCIRDIEADGQRAARIARQLDATSESKNSPESQD